MAAASSHRQKSGLRPRRPQGLPNLYHCPRGDGKGSVPTEETENRGVCLEEELLPPHGCLSSSGEAGDPGTTRDPAKLLRVWIPTYHTLLVSKVTLPPPSSVSQTDREGCAKGNCLLLSPLGLLCCSSFFWTLWLFEWVPFSIESFHCISYLHRHQLYVGCLESVNQIAPCGASHNLQG